jgi:nitrogen regulatory protein PII
MKEDYVADENLDLITCVVQRGKADGIVKAASKAGAEGATIFFARGTGVRERLGLLGIAISPEKEVIIIVTEPEKTEAIFSAIVEAGKLTTPGQGIVYVTEIKKIAGIPVKKQKSIEKKTQNAE